MGILWQDIRFGLRMLAKSPGFTVVAALTLALGIGANTAIFSVIKGVLLRPMPYEEADRLMFMTEWSEQVPNMSFSIANFKDLRDRNTAFESIAANNSANLIHTGQGEAERLVSRQVTSGLFQTLRLKPLLGRPITPDDDRPGAAPVVLLGEGYWTRRFGRDPGIVGQQLTISGVSFTVIGVLPARFHGGWRTIDVFTPLLRLEDQLGGEKNRGNHPGVYVYGRLKAGVTVEQARADVERIAKHLAEQYPNSNAKRSMTLRPLRDVLVEGTDKQLYTLLGAVAFVLLIACVNVANLLLARAGSRHKEIALRMAMGAPRRRLMRQLLTESTLLALLGGALGLLVAYWGIKGLVGMLPDSQPGIEQVRMDGTVLAFTLGISLLTGLVFGVLPAWKSSWTSLHDTLKEGGRGTLGTGHHRLRNTLAVGEIALAFVLLVGAGLMLRSLLRVREADAGFDRAGVLTASVSLPQTKFSDDAKRAAFAREVVENVSAMPGVRAAAATLPLLGGWQSGFSVEGKPEPPPGQLPAADITRVTPDYARAMGLRVLQGRFFTDRDTAERPRICIVDETFAKTFWPEESPLGKHVKFGTLSNTKEPWMEVVGVVNHVKNYGVDQTSRVELYLPYYQSPVDALTLLVRTDASPRSLAPAVRQAVSSADADVPLFGVRTLEEIVSANTGQRRTAAILLGVFAALGLVLAAVGIYGVMSYTVAQRTQEIGIRMALGAPPNAILGMVLRHGTLISLLGIAIGLAAALGLAQFIASQLFQVKPTDPPTFSIVPLILMGVALLACYLPARRATRVDPLVALRYE
jgi:putative ABC transport system permease protein